MGIRINMLLGWLCFFLLCKFGIDGDWIWFILMLATIIISIGYKEKS